MIFRVIDELRLVQLVVDLVVVLLGIVMKPVEQLHSGMRSQSYGLPRPGMVPTDSL
jgi:hypothetical protein